MKRMLLPIMCISFAASYVAGVDISDKNTHFPQTALAGGIRSKAADAEPYFKLDPDAKRKLEQVHDCREPDVETSLKNNAELKEQYSRKHVISCLGVVITNNIRFCTAPARGVVYEHPAPILFIARTGDDGAMIATVRDHQIARLTDIDRTDPNICRLLDVMKKSNLPIPAIIVVDNKTVDDKDCDGFWPILIKNVGDGLVPIGFDASEGNIIFRNVVPGYLFGNGQTSSVCEIFKSFRKPGFGRLSDLVVLGGKNASRDYYDPNGKPKYFFINTINSAPVELSKSDLENISSKQILFVRGANAMIISMKNGDTVTFGGLSAVNPDFLKSDNEQWKTVVGLSSPNGFTIAVDYVDGDKTVRVSGEDIRKNTLNIQDKLPKSVVEMIKISVPGMESLTEALKDSDENIRKEAAVALGETKDERVVDSLIAATRDNNVEVRKVAVCALGNIRDARAVDSLITALNDKDYYVCQLAVGALGQIGQPALEPLLAALKDENMWLRRNIPDALGQIGDVRAVEPLIALLKDKDAGVRGSAAAALGKIGDIRAIDPLIASLKDGDNSVCASAAEALGKIGVEKLQPPQQALYYVYKGKFDKAAEIGQPAVEPLIASLKNKNVYTRRSAAEALGKIGGAQVVDSLIYLLKDKDENVRQVASFGLSRIGQPAIKPLLEHYSNVLAKDEWMQITLAACGHGESEASVLKRLRSDAYSPATKTWIIGCVGSESFLKRIEETAADMGLRIAARAARLGGGEWSGIIQEAIDKPEILEPTLSALSYSQIDMSMADKVEDLCLSYIRRGDIRIIPQLTRLLDMYGSKQLAEDYLNCGQNSLESAATTWAYSRGYNIGKGYGSKRASWGSNPK